ncbi:MAG: hypothetical protein WD638_04175 [Nitriliruptoraceae bacterium]
MGQSVRTDSMGAASYLLVGTGGAALCDELAGCAIPLRGVRREDLPEEAPYACEDLDAVVDVCDRVGLGCKVARLRPLGMVEG